MNHRSVLSSRSETTAVITAFIECLRYIIMKHEADVALCEKLIKTQLFSLLHWSLTNQQSSSKILFNQVTMLVQYWSRSRDNPDTQHYSKYLDYFWSNVSSLFEGLILNLQQNFEKNAVADLAAKQVELILSLKHVPKSKKQTKVSFETSISDQTAEQPDLYKSNALNDSYMDSLNNLVYNTCQAYVEFINEKVSKELIEHLVSLMQDFVSKDFFQYLSNRLTGDADSKLISVFNGILSKWLLSDALCCKAVVDLVFLLFAYLEIEEKALVLDIFKQVSYTEYFYMIHIRGVNFNTPNY